MRGDGAQGLHAQHALRIAAEYLCLILVTDRSRREPLGGGRVFHERPIDGEQDTVDAHFHNAT